MKLKISGEHSGRRDDLEALIERQIGYALGRFEPKIREIDVRLRDLNGPKGGIDKHCRISVRFRAGGSVLADVSDVEYEPVIVRAVDRVSRRVQRYWHTAHTRDRSAALARKSESGVGG